MEKFNIVHAGRYFGKSYDAAQKLYHEIQKAEKTILFKTPKGDVHILPQKKLDEHLTQTRQEALQEALENFRTALAYNVTEEEAERIMGALEALQAKIESV